MLAGSESICGRCHETDSAGGKLAVEMGARIRSLEQALGGSDEVLNQARRAGMEVSEALVRQVEGRENLVKARVAVHAFELAAVEKPIKEGLAIAAETHRAGQAALKERDFRRTGLGLALIAILVTIIGLWLAIRSIERRPEPEASASGR
jgi:hypothetical protein